jgi:hypothetical protein
MSNTNTRRTTPAEVQQSGDVVIVREMNDQPILVLKAPPKKTDK